MIRRLSNLKHKRTSCSLFDMCFLSKAYKPKAAICLMQTLCMHMMSDDKEVINSEAQSMIKYSFCLFDLCFLSNACKPRTYRLLCFNHTMLEPLQFLLYCINCLLYCTAMRNSTVTKLLLINVLFMYFIVLTVVIRFNKEQYRDRPHFTHLNTRDVIQIDPFILWYSVTQSRVHIRTHQLVLVQTRSASPPNLEISRSFSTVKRQLGRTRALDSAL